MPSSNSRAMIGTQARACPLAAYLDSSICVLSRPIIMATLALTQILGGLSHHRSARHMLLIDPSRAMMGTTRYHCYSKAWLLPIAVRLSPDP